ncbi:ABC transporter permease subunit [Sulfuritalea sp.]|uniref:ABC transporter permease subunit n=1 Tax=Sulfuritalea sp. TaxID=2480090 RepID=UPI00286DCE62|nr:ABC transporter permease subunit [Sulfuritalea sp.]
MLDKLAQPSMQHWLGTDWSGHGVMDQLIRAVMHDAASFAFVSGAVFCIGLAGGLALARIPQHSIRSTLIAGFHVLQALPTLLLALLLAAHSGAGWWSPVLVILLAVLPSQILVAYRMTLTVMEEPFIEAKRSIGLSEQKVFLRHALPAVLRRYATVVRSRLIEILFLLVAIEFVGLGVDATVPTLGKLLFDGLTFREAAWWVWGPASVAIALLSGMLGYLTLGRR